MRITHIVESLERGGLERVVVDLSKGLKQRGHDVDVVCLFKRGLLASELVDAGIPVTVFTKRRGLDVSCGLALRRHLLRRQPHVVHTHNAVAGYYSAVAAWGVLARSFWINTRHGMGAMGSGSRREWLYRVGSGRYDRLAFVCEAARRNFIAKRMAGFDRSIVLYNGIDMRRWNPCSDAIKREKKRAIGLAAETLVVGSVGRLNWAKDFVGLVNAYASAFPDADSADRLIIVGEGAERVSIERRARELRVDGKLMLLGDRSDVPDLLGAFDLFACSSKTEGYSMALLEAAACGLPVIATDVGGNREIVETGVTGVIVPPGAPEVLGGALRELATTPELRTRMAGRAREWAAANADLGIMVDRHLAAYAGTG